MKRLDMTDIPGRLSVRWSVELDNALDDIMYYTLLPELGDGINWLYFKLDTIFDLNREQLYEEIGTDRDILSEP